MQQLPKLYAPVNIRFWSLRNGLGSNLGVVFDIDTEVIRKCMRVLCEEGWKWQIVEYNTISEWDYVVETDKEILDEYGAEIEFDLVQKKELQDIQRREFEQHGCYMGWAR